MRYFYMAIQYLPFWSIPIALSIGEVGWHFRRKGEVLKLAACWLVSLAIISVTIFWVLNHGDRDSARWLQRLVS